jgi:hypothetical protein
MGWLEIFDMKIVYALPKNLGLMIGVDHEAQHAPGASPNVINVRDHFPIRGQQFPVKRE